LSTKKKVATTISIDDWIAPAQAARIRGVSRQAIAKLIKAGRVATVEIGGRTLVRLADIKNFQPRKAGRRKRGVVNG
jgi:hypothetical protein